MMKIKNLTILSLMVLLSFSMVSALFEDVTLISVGLVNQDPDPAIAGNVVEIRFSVENLGGNDINNLMFELTSEYPFELVSGEDAVKEVGIIKGFQTGEDMKIMKYTLMVNRDAIAGNYELKIKYYEEGSTIKTARTFSIELDNKESAEVIYINQVELIPGKIIPLKFTINNVGSAPLRELTFQWENEDDIILPVGSDNTKYIKYIDVGESKELEFDVIASTNADPDLYKLDLFLTYSDPVTGEDKEINTKAGVYVGGATDFDVSLSDTSNGELTFSIANIGSVAASSVTVKIPNQQGWKIMGSNSVIIGNLNEGDYTIASFTMIPTTIRTPDTSTQKGGQDMSTVKVDVVYTDSRGNRNTIKKEVSVDSSMFQTIEGEEKIISGGMQGRMGVQQESFWQKYDLMIIGAVVLTLLICARNKYKKEKIEDSNYTYKQLAKEAFHIKKK